MPLIVSNARNIEVDIVTRLEGEVGGTLDHEVDNFGWEHHPSHNIGFPLLRPGLANTDQLLTREHNGWTYEPLPEVGSMNNCQDPEDNVEKMCPVKHLKYF